MATATPVHTDVPISAANMNSPTRRTGAGPRSQRSATTKANNDTIAATTTIALLSKCSWCPIGTAPEASRAAHAASELGAHTSVHTVLSKPVATAKTPSIDSNLSQ